MVVSRIGIFVPRGHYYREPIVGGCEETVNREPIRTEINGETGMIYNLFEGDHGTALISSEHEDVGLVTWWRADNEADGHAWIETALRVQVSR